MNKTSESLGLRLGSVDTHDDGVVPLVGLERDLLHGLEVLLPELLHLLGEDSLGGGRGIDTVGLDGDDEVTAVLEELVGVDGHDTGLIGLGNIGKDDIDHSDEHSVLEGVTGILDDGDDVGPLLGDVDEISARAVGELNSVHHSLLHIWTRGTKLAAAEDKISEEIYEGMIV